jgi:hypothetical protein
MRSARGVQKLLWGAKTLTDHANENDLQAEPSCGTPTRPRTCAKRRGWWPAQGKGRRERLWGSQPLPGPSRATAAGDAAKLRGIPAVGRGVSGALLVEALDLTKVPRPLDGVLAAASGNPAR